MGMYSQFEYNNEPVFYCSGCLSLNIKELTKTKEEDKKLFVCRECGHAHISETSIDNWTELYNKEYGKYFMDEE